MKQKVKLTMGFIVLAIALVTISCKSNAAKSEAVKAEEQKIAEVQYTCPMHPEVLQNVPGTCPECGMDLVVKSDDMDSTAMDHMHE